MPGMAVSLAMPSAHPGLPHEFHVGGSPVSVNRYGTAGYRNWRARVHSRSIAYGAWNGALVDAPCTVRVRYFQYQDRRKDVDNILKAILDGLDGKIGAGGAPAKRVLQNDRDVERVTSQRSKIDFHTRFRSLTLDEYLAARAALVDGAAVFVCVDDPPDHNESITR